MSNREKTITAAIAELIGELFYVALFTWVCFDMPTVCRVPAVFALLYLSAIARKK